MDDVREHAVARLCCPTCGDWLVPVAALEPDVGGAERSDLRCLGCAARYPWRDGVLDLGIADDGRAMARRFPHDKREISFLELLDDTIRMAVNSDRTPEDELYALLSWLDPYPGQATLHLGCDDGRITPPLAQAVHPGLLLCMESDMDLLQRAKLRCLQVGVENAVLVRADLRRPPVRPHCFDRIVLTGVLHGEESARAYVERVAEALIPEGVLAGIALATSKLDQFAAHQEQFGRKAGITFADIHQLGNDLCRGAFVGFQMDQASNWMARFVARKEGLDPRGSL